MSAASRTLTPDVLDQLQMGILVCDYAGKIIFANAAAKDLQPKSRGTLLARLVLDASGKEQSQKLAQIIAAAAAGGAGGAIALSSAEGTERILAVVAPMPKSRQSDWAGHAIVAFRRSSREADLPGPLLSQLFGLTPSQANLATAIYNGTSVEEFAEKRGVKVSTVRSHLAEVLARTGTSSQRDLVRLLGMLPPLQIGF